jgi:hypothetical protein
MLIRFCLSTFFYVCLNILVLSVRSISLRRIVYLCHLSSSQSYKIVSQRAHLLCRELSRCTAHLMALCFSIREAAKGASVSARRVFAYCIQRRVRETLTCVQRLDLAVVHVHDLLQMSHEQSRIDGHSVQLGVPRVEDVVDANLGK